jgi:hypothetical protein
MNAEIKRRSLARAPSGFDTAIQDEGCNSDDSIINKSPSAAPTGRKRAKTKQFLDANIQRLTARQKQRLAQRLGYESFDNVIAASTVITLSDGSSWWLTVDLIGRRTAWNLFAISVLTDERRVDYAAHRRGRNVGGSHTRRDTE